MTKKIAAVTKKFFNEFAPAFLARKTDVPITTICCHQSRGKISACAAEKYCDVHEVKKVYRKEILRPDIKNW